MDFVTFKVGGEDYKVGPLTLQRLKKMWPSVEGMGQGGSLVESYSRIAIIVAVAIEKDEDRLDTVSAEDLARPVERKFLSHEVAYNQTAFGELMKISGLGPKPGNASAAANLSTETGTA